MEFFMVMFEILGTLGLLFAVVWIVEPRETFEGLPWPLGPPEISDSPHQGGVARGHYKSLTEEEVQQRINDDHCGVWYGEPEINGEDGEVSLCLRKVRK